MYSTCCTAGHRHPGKTNAGIDIPASKVLVRYRVKNMPVSVPLLRYPTCPGTVIFFLYLTDRLPESPVVRILASLCPCLCPCPCPCPFPWGVRVRVPFHVHDIHVHDFHVHDFHVHDFHVHGVHVHKVHVHEVHVHDVHVHDEHVLHRKIK
jgi:hypothetical protein